jgi:hypothetical protein
VRKAPEHRKTRNPAENPSPPLLLSIARSRGTGVMLHGSSGRVGLRGGCAATRGLRGYAGVARLRGGYGAAREFRQCVSGGLVRGARDLCRCAGVRARRWRWWSSWRGGCAGAREVWPGQNSRATRRARPAQVRGRCASHAAAQHPRAANWGRPPRACARKLGISVTYQAACALERGIPLTQRCLEVTAPGRPSDATMSAPGRGAHPLIELVEIGAGAA